jgi:microcin C transport system substrate-binding protein
MMAGCGAGGLGMRIGLITLAAAGILLGATQAGAAQVRTALALWGEPKLSEGFTHLPYANPDAPKGGRVMLASPGTFDNLNTIVLRGTYPRSLGLIADSLMTTSGDELDAAYPLLAKSVELADDLSSAVFVLDERARWNDGRPITAGDVVFAWNAIQAHGAPFLKSFLVKTRAVEAEGPLRVKASFTTTGERKPVIDFATTMTPLPEHWWTANGRDVSKTTLEPVLGAGPYRIASVDAGRSIVYERVKDYWAADLPVNKGLYNFDRIQVDYYRDDDVMFEAFKAGAYDFHVEMLARRWATGYDFPAFKDGRVQRRVEPSHMPKGAQGIRLNMRRAQLADPKVREALAHLFDFAWLQKNILNGEYERVKSNFPNSDYGASGLPTPEELALLEPLRGKVDPRVFTQAFEPPPGGDMRAAQRAALALFKEAGWEPKDGKLVKVATGEPFRIEFLENDQAMLRVLQPFVTNLRRAGVDASVRLVDDAQLQVREDEFDFDAVVAAFNFFPPPGQEMWSYFGSEAAAAKGSANYSGIADPAVDELIRTVLSAKDETTLKAANRALDRVMLWKWPMIPQWYKAENWLAYKTRFGWPQRWPLYDITFANNWMPVWWWIADPKER